MTPPSDYTLTEVANALSSSRWEALANSGVKADAVLLRGEAVLVEVVAGNVDEAANSDSGFEDFETDVFMVARIGTQFFKKTGYYMSHSGITWYGNLKEVKPATKTVTVYE